MNFITDPWFYVWAIPAVIITGISKTGLGAGVGGVAVPMMSQVIAPGAAAGIMLPILCVIDIETTGEAPPAEVIEVGWHDVDTDVREVVVTRGRVTGVRLDSGEVVPADAVVFNGDVSALMQWPQPYASFVDQGTQRSKPYPFTPQAERSALETFDLRTKQHIAGFLARFT